MSVGEQLNNCAGARNRLCQDADVRLEVSPKPTWAWDAIRPRLDCLRSGP